MLDEEQFDILLAELQSAENFQIPKNLVLYVAKGHLRGQIDTVGVLGGLVSAPDLARTPVSQLVARVLSGFSGFQYSSRELRAPWDALKQTSDLSVTLFQPALDLIIELYEFLESVYSDCSSVETDLSITRRPPWWSSRPKVVADIEKWRKRFQVERNAGRPVSTILSKLDAMHVVLKELQRSVAPKDADPFVVASAMCFVGSERALARGAQNPALMLALRAVEYLLTAIAFNANLARYTPNGIKLTSGEDLGVIKLVDLLVNSSVLPVTFQTGHLFGELNSARNQLTLTHGFAGVSALKLEGALRALSPILRSLGTGHGWWSKVRTLQPSPSEASSFLQEIFEFDRLVFKYDHASLSAAAMGS